MAAALNAKLAEQGAALEKLSAARASEAAALAQEGAGDAGERAARAPSSQRRSRSWRRTASASRRSWARDAKDLADLRSQAAAEAQRARDAVAAAEAAARATLGANRGAGGRAVTHEEEMTVLMAHLNEARRPMQERAGGFQAREAMSSRQKTLSLEQLTEENRTLRTTLERTRGALEERDLLIRRLERSANNNANVLGRLQTSIERLGSARRGAHSGGRGLHGGAGARRRRAADRPSRWGAAPGSAARRDASCKSIRSP